MILKSNKLVFTIKVLKFKFINKVRFEIQFFVNILIALYKENSLILKSNKIVFTIKVLKFKFINKVRFEIQFLAIF